MLEILECLKKLFHRVELGYKLDTDVLIKMCQPDFFFYILLANTAKKKWSSSAFERCF